MSLNNTRQISVVRTRCFCFQLDFCFEEEGVSRFSGWAIVTGQPSGGERPR